VFGGSAQVVGAPMTFSYFILFVVGAVLIAAGLAQLVNENPPLGVGLVLLGLVVGPGGYYFFRSRERTTR
jgi:hypothetical protein